MAECNKAKQWLLERTQQQELMPKNADPVLWSSEIKKKTDILDVYVSVSLLSYNSKDAYVPPVIYIFEQLDVNTKGIPCQNFCWRNPDRSLSVVMLIICGRVNVDKDQKWSFPFSFR